MDEPPFWRDEYAWIRDFLGIEESEDRRALGILQALFDSYRLSGSVSQEGSRL
jgi:hypothetical protein